jgi:cytochrome oxidase Cu insertion factor (SCO1/SenC/PrrC family)
MNRKLLLGITAMIVLALLVTGCTDDNGDEEEEEDNLKTAPGFSLTSIDGDSIDLSEYEGKVVILDFMYVACQYCDDEMEELKSVYSNYDDNEVVIMTIDILPDDDNETELRNFGEEYGDDWIYAFDTDNLVNKYNVVGVPKVVIINKNGKIAHEHTGLTKYSTLSSEIDELL